MIHPIQEIIAREWPVVRDILAPPVPYSATRTPITGEFWELRISPGIPVTWPPQKGWPELDFYASAAGRDLVKLVDGEYFSNPWGRVRANLTLPAFEFESLPERPAKAGIQGVRPLLASEAEIMADSMVVVDLASALADGSISPALAARVRAYYGLWLKTNGVARVIRPLHPKFFEWVLSAAT